MSTQHAVYMEFNGQRTRVGTAVQGPDGSFSIALGGLLVVGSAEASAPRHAGGSGAVFPPFGKSKGAPIAGASMRDLEFYANCAVRSLNDPSKARWHDKECMLLDAINAEIIAQGGTPVHVREEYGQAPADDGIGRRRSDEQDDIPF